MARECGGDFRFRRISVAREQRHDRHDDAVDAISTLGSLLVDECLLHGVQLVATSQTLDGRDVVPRRRPERRIAGLHRVAIEKHGARAAVAFATTESRSFELEIVAQNVQERRLRRCRHRAIPAIHAQLEAFGHGFSEDVIAMRIGSPATRLAERLAR